MENIIVECVQNSCTLLSRKCNDTLPFSEYVVEIACDGVQNSNSSILASSTTAVNFSTVYNGP